MRVIYGENDGLPGLIADLYNDVLVLKLYSAIWKPYLKDIVEALVETTSATSVVLRLNRKLQHNSRLGYSEGDVLYGEMENSVVHFHEYGVNFIADVIKGHKTGYFLDHRQNRREVGERSAGKRVLDVFSYAGGFSVHALAGGASEVVSVDISKQALDLSR